MSLTRKMLEALGVEAKAIEQIIEAHTEVTDALKKERDTYKASADTLESVQKELEYSYDGSKLKFENCTEICKTSLRF